ncbi:MAG: DmsE family decaheme c-type cytochrome [Acidobacteria bacterium]|nr:DmsE family decaheme c-type cytochrome [Acidobacteriota bacterium]
MPESRNGFPARSLLMTLAVVWAVSVSAVAAKPEPESKAINAAVAQAADYVGQDTCLVCHGDRNYVGTAHALTSNDRTPASTHGCESCHGPGKAHAESAGDKTKIVNLKTLTPQRASETCTACHDRAKHALWAGSQHDQRNVGCLNCHSVHSPKGEKQIKASTEPELCGTCHKNIVNRLYRFNHMPVREGKIQCSSCHNPHGSTNQKLLKMGTTVDESCTSCHTEKRGPYLWEHAPVANACVTCHDPHGSNNERMLASKPPFLCQRCHVTSRHPPTVYDGFLLKNSTNANKVFGRECLACHQQIHGSNAPSGKAFLR